MDQIDTKIIEMLEDNGRVSYATIARAVGLTSTAVSQRIQKLIDEELILGFGVKLNKEKLGITIQAIISVKLNFAKIDTFYKTLSTYNEIEMCYRITGEDCLMMKVNFKDNAHLLSFINNISKYGFSKSNIIIEQVI